MRKKIALMIVSCLMITSSLLVSCSPNLSGGEPSLTDLPYLVEGDSTEVDSSDRPVTPVDELHTTGLPPDIDIDEYRLLVDGLVATPLSLTYEDLQSYPTITETVLLVCPGLFVDNAVWTGIPLEILLEEAGVQPDASLIYFRGADSYREYISYSYLEEVNVFLAYKVNGQVLPIAHGYPLRVVVDGEFGSKWVKWLEEIEIK